MRDEVLTEIMFRSLYKDHKLASYEEWIKAGDYALDIRFFPHALQCFRLASEHRKDDNVLQRLNDTIDKITNVLEFVPAEIKATLEDFRLNNPLDPSRWLKLSAEVLKQYSDQVARGLEAESLLRAAKFTLGFTAYASLRSGIDVEEINSLLRQLESKPSIHRTPSIKLAELGSAGKQVKIVILGDNISLGLTSSWELRFQDVYAFQWAKELKYNISLANNSVSGAGVMDLALYLGRDAIYYKPQIALINYGINDVWLGPEILPAYEALLESSVSILLEHGILPVLISPSPHIPSACPSNQRPADYTDAELAIQPLVEAVLRVAQRLQVPFVNAFERFPQEDAKLKHYLENGFNQLNKAGHKLIKEALNEVTEF